MAELGKGDPRWLVEAREDGQNVNNWHWTEADLTPWAKTTLISRLGNLSLVDTDALQATVTKADKFEGEVTVSTRKGKTIFFYDLGISLEWTGGMKDKSLDGVKGKIVLGDIEQDSSIDEFEFRLSISGAETDAHRILKEAIKDAGRKAIGQVIAQFNTDLRERAGLAVAGEKPKKKTMDVETLAQKTESGDLAVPASSADKVETVKTASGGSIKTTSFSATEKFRCRPADLVSALTESARVKAFTQDGSAQVASAEGEQFRLYDGLVSGTLCALDAEGMSMDWRLRAWPAGHHARIDLKMTFEGDHTVLTLSAKKVPAGEKDNTTRAWDHYYWQRVRHVFGFKL